MAATMTDFLESGLVTIAEACRFLAASRSFVYQRMDRGELPFAKLGRARRIPRRALIEYAARHLVGGVRGDER